MVLLPDTIYRLSSTYQVSGPGVARRFFLRPLPLRVSDDPTGNHVAGPRQSVANRCHHPYFLDATGGAVMAFRGAALSAPEGKAPGKTEKLVR